MTLDHEDIAAIATEVVRQLRQAEQSRIDQRYEAHLPIEEQKRRQQERMRVFKAEQKRLAGLKRA